MYYRGYRGQRARAFGRQTSSRPPPNQNQNQNQNQAQGRNNASSPTAYSPSSLGPPSLPPAPASPSLSATMAVNDQAVSKNQAPRNPPFFFREAQSTLIVKGNFNTLAFKPVLVEEGEWMSHQLVEQNRLLTGMVKIVQTSNSSRGGPCCNEQTCPTMSAGSTVYTWIDTNRNPINLPAAQYMKNIQTWVTGKTLDPSLFPTDTFTSAPPLVSAANSQSTDPNHWLGKASGFPQRFETEIKNMYKQMFRCYAHLYWAHWMTFYDLKGERELNTCFVHFVNVGLMYNLLSERDIEPMRPLIDIWIRSGVLPKMKDSETAPASAGVANGSGSHAATPTA